MPGFPDHLIDGLIFFTYQKEGASTSEPYVIWAGAGYREMLKRGKVELDRRLQTGVGGIRDITSAYRAFDPGVTRLRTTAVLGEILERWPSVDSDFPVNETFMKVSGVLVPGGTLSHGVQYLTGAKLAGAKAGRPPASLREYILAMTPSGCYRTFKAGGAQYLSVGEDTMEAMEAWDLYWNEPLLDFLSSMR